MKRWLSPAALRRTAWVAGVYAFVVLGLLVWDAVRRPPPVPTDRADFVALKEAAHAAPQQAELRDEVRAADQSLRAEYFRTRRFAQVGLCLLLLGTTVMLVAARGAANLQRRLPQPTLPPVGLDLDENQRRLSRIAVVVAAAVTVGGAWALWTARTAAMPDLRLALEGGGPREPAAARVPPADSRPAAMVQLAPGPAPADPVPPTSVPSAAVPSAVPVAAVPSPTAAARAASWPSFRGPDGSGATELADLPEAWDGASGDGVRWRSAVPLPGASSPIVVGGRVLLTGASEKRLEVYCWDADTGELLWQREVQPGSPEALGKIQVNPDAGLAGSTMASDGLRVYALFATGDLAAFDLSGQEQWKISLGVPKNVYGHAASLAVHEDRVVVQFDQGRAADKLSRLMALDGATGQVVWETPRDVGNSWSSPVVIVHDGEPQIITCANPWLIANAARDGRELWRASCLEGDVAPSAVYADGVVYVANEGAALTAVRAGGAGDVTATHVLWHADVGLPDICSPLVVGEFVLLMPSYGALTCYDRAMGGEPLWEEDFGEDCASSPARVGERVYVVGRSGKCWIVRPTRAGCERLGEMDLGEECVTCPAFEPGRIFLRGKEHLFCLERQA